MLCDNLCSSWRPRLKVGKGKRRRTLTTCQGLAPWLRLHYSRPPQESAWCGAAVFLSLADRVWLQACSWSHRYRRISTRSEEHTSELQSLMRISYAVFCLKKKKIHKKNIE